jgi:hypothetical protein
MHSRPRYGADGPVPRTIFGETTLAKEPPILVSHRTADAPSRSPSTSMALEGRVVARGHPAR